MSEGKRVPQFTVAFLASGFAFLTGTALGWTNPIGPKAYKGELGFKISRDEFSWASSILPLGAVLACIPAGFLMDGIGRLWSAVLTVIPHLIGWLSISFARNFWMLLFGRAVLGIAIGGSCVSIPIYIGEISQKDIRGILGSFFQLHIAAGALFVFIFGAFMKPLSLNIVCTVLPVVFAIIMFFLPESPQYLIRKDKTEKAEKSFACLRGKEYDAKPEVDAAKVDIEAAKQGKPSLCQSFKNRACLKALCISLGLMLFQQLSGINVLIFYSTDIFIDKNSAAEPACLTITIGVILLVSTAVSALFVDKFGRRLLLMISACFIALSTLVLGIYFLLGHIDGNLIKNKGWLALVALCIYMAAFAFGFGPVPWIMLGEVFPLEVKGLGSSLACFTNFLSAFTVVKIFPLLNDALGVGQTLWILSILSIIGFLFVLFFVRETKKKSLTEIQDVLKGSK